MLLGVTTVLVIFIGLLTIPVKLIFEISWKQDFQGTLKLCWAFGLANLTLPLPLRTKNNSVENNQIPAKNNNRIGGSSFKKRRVMSAVRQKAFRKRILRFFHDFWHAIKKSNVRMRVRIGLEDPADTGILWAIVGPISGILTHMRDVFIEIEPEFTEATFELNCSGKLRLIPLQMIYLIIALLLSAPFWKAMKQMRAAV